MDRRVALADLCNLAPFVYPKLTLVSRIIMQLGAALVVASMDEKAWTSAAAPVIYICAFANLPILALSDLVFLFFIWCVVVAVVLATALLVLMSLERARRGAQGAGSNRILRFAVGGFGALHVPLFTIVLSMADCDYGEFDTMPGASTRFGSPVCFGAPISAVLFCLAVGVAAVFGTMAFGQAFLQPGEKAVSSIMRRSHSRMEAATIACSLALVMGDILLRHYRIMFALCYFVIQLCLLAGWLVLQPLHSTRMQALNCGLAAIPAWCGLCFLILVSSATDNQASAASILLTVGVVPAAVGCGWVSSAVRQRVSMYGERLVEGVKDSRAAFLQAIDAFAHHCSPIMSDSIKAMIIEIASRNILNNDPTAIKSARAMLRRGIIVLPQSKYLRLQYAAFLLRHGDLAGTSAMMQTCDRLNFGLEGFVKLTLLRRETAQLYRDHHHRTSGTSLTESDLDDTAIKQRLAAIRVVYMHCQQLMTHIWDALHRDMQGSNASKKGKKRFRRARIASSTGAKQSDGGAALTVADDSDKAVMQTLQSMAKDNDVVPYSSTKIDTSNNLALDSNNNDSKTSTMKQRPVSPPMRDVVVQGKPLSAWAFGQILGDLELLRDEEKKADEMFEQLMSQCGESPEVLHVYASYVRNVKLDDSGATSLEARRDAAIANREMMARNTVRTMARVGSHHQFDDGDDVDSDGAEHHDDTDGSAPASPSDDDHDDADGKRAAIADKWQESIKAVQAPASLTTTSDSHSSTSTSSTSASDDDDHDSEHSDNDNSVSSAGSGERVVGTHTTKHRLVLRMDDSDDGSISSAAGHRRSPAPLRKRIGLSRSSPAARPLVFTPTQLAHQASNQPDAAGAAAGRSGWDDDQSSDSSANSSRLSGAEQAVLREKADVLASVARSIRRLTLSLRVTTLCLICFASALVYVFITLTNSASSSATDTDCSGFRRSSTLELAFASRRMHVAALLNDKASFASAKASLVTAYTTVQLEHTLLAYNRYIMLDRLRDYQTTPSVPMREAIGDTNTTSIIDTTLLSPVEAVDRMISAAKDVAAMSPATLITFDRTNPATLPQLFVLIENALVVYRALDTITVLFILETDAIIANGVGTLCGLAAAAIVIEFIIIGVVLYPAARKLFANLGESVRRLGVIGPAERSTMLSRFRAVREQSEMEIYGESQQQQQQSTAVEAYSSGGGDGGWMSAQRGMSSEYEAFDSRSPQPVAGSGVKERGRVRFAGAVADSPPTSGKQHVGEAFSGAALAAMSTHASVASIDDNDDDDAEAAAAAVMTPHSASDSVASAQSHHAFGLPHAVDDEEESSSIPPFPASPQHANVRRLTIDIVIDQADSCKEDAGTKHHDRAVEVAGQAEKHALDELRRAEASAPDAKLVIPRKNAERRAAFLRWLALCFVLVSLCAIMVLLVGYFTTDQLKLYSRQLNNVGRRRSMSRGASWMIFEIAQCSNTTTGLCGGVSRVGPDRATLSCYAKAMIAGAYQTHQLDTKDEFSWERGALDAGLAVASYNTNCSVFTEFADLYDVARSISSAAVDHDAAMEAFMYKSGSCLADLSEMSGAPVMSSDRLQVQTLKFNASKCIYFNNPKTPQTQQGLNRLFYDVMVRYVRLATANATTVITPADPTYVLANRFGMSDEFTLGLTKGTILFENNMMVAQASNIQVMGAAYSILMLVALVQRTWLANRVRNAMEANKRVSLIVLRLVGSVSKKRKGGLCYPS